MRSRRTVAVLLAATTLAVGGCDGITPSQQGSEREGTPRQSAPAPPAPQGLQRFYTQQVEWEDCDDGFECGSVEVPLSYTDPGGDTIEIAVNRRLADEERVGSLTVNPGGPGASGIDYVEQAETQFGSDLLAGYDIVGFDPRGVGESRPVDCVRDEELDEFVALDPSPDDPGEAEEFVTAIQALGAGCAERSGELAGHVSTVEAARDLDVLRAALGEPRLDYYGASYGTRLGATYADLFPRNVGRMVLDGAVDPSLSPVESTLDQAAGFQRATEAYLAHCVQQEVCPLGPTAEEAEQELVSFFESVDEQPLPADGNRELTVGWAVLGVWLPLYVDEAWPLLDAALASAIEEGDGRALLQLADLYVSRGEEGYVNNSVEALYAVNCLDQPATRPVSEVEASVEDFVDASPVFGDVFAWGTTGCVDWPVEAAEKPPEIDAPGAAPIVVVGTTRDPATPYEWAVGLAELLESGVLVTYDGDGHTAYGRGSDCVDTAVEDYLLDGTVPEDGLRC